MDAPIRLIVGLGNPGEQYEGTPHNIGRALVQFLAARGGHDWRREKNFEWAGRDPALMLPGTFMNLSGEAVAQALKKFNCGPENLLVCVDEFDIPLGTLRIRKKGSAGTHNGMKSVVSHLGTQEFARLRLGVGPVPPGADPAHFVLKPFAKSQRDSVKEMIERAANAVDCAVSEGIEIAMNRFNGGSAS